MESSVQYRKTLNLLSEIYILVTESGGICDLNESAVNLWGWNYNRYLTKSIFELGSFRVADSKRRLDYLCDDGASRYTFVAKETIYGELLLSARMHSVVVNDKRCIAVVMESRHEIQQIKEKLEQEYHNNFVMFENSVCGIIHLNGKEIINANTQAYSLLKISYDIRGEQFSSIFPDTRRKKRHIVTTAANRMEEVFNYEFSTKGKRTLLEVHLFDVDKENTFCYFIDTTQHKSAPLSLANLSSRYRAIVEQSPCGVLIGDKNGDIIDVSGRFCEMIRMPAVEILGKNISALFTESSIKVKPLDYVRVDAGEIISAERELKCGDGTIKIVEMYSSVISTDMYQAVVLDITPRKIYENQMLDYRRQVHDMDMEKAHFLKMSKDITAIFTVDANIKDIFVGESSPFYRYFNSEKEFIERFLSYISRKDYDMMLKQGIANAIAGNENKEQKVEIVIGGTLLILEVRFMLIENDVLVVISDVTERERIITELNRALKKSEENEKLQAAFLSNLSHELRTPMNGVIGFADILLEGEDNPQKQEYLRIILNSSYQLLSVLSDIIEMSKLEAGVVQAKSEIVSVKKIIGDVCALMRTEHSVTDNNVQIMNLAQEHKETHIISDSTKLKQIITNLISNAIKFTKNGKVEVDFSETDEKVCITVRDNGVGISKRDIDHIFDRFFQTNNAKAATKGAGLGLAIVKSYVDMLQGTIRVESEEGKGSCFYVELPNNY
jgi:PAS domain S-box-containing protein